MHTLGARLRKAREDDDYVETDLRVWTNKLKQLRSNAIGVLSTARIYEDSTKVFVGNVSMPQGVIAFFFFHHEINNVIASHIVSFSFLSFFLFVVLPSS